MKAQPEDVVLAKVSASGPESARAEVPSATNVETVRFETGTTPFVPGQAVPIQLTTVNEGSARGAIKRGRYKRYYFPGDTVDVTVGEPLKPGICKAPTDELPNIDRLYVVGVRPDSYVRARIDLIRDGSAFARPVSVHSMGIQPGDVLAAETEPDTTLATLSRNGFKVELDTKTFVAAEIRVEIEAVEKTIQAVIADPMNLPVVGNRITAETKPDTTTASATPGGYDIQIDEHVHSTYGVTVEVESVDHSSTSIDGRIIDKSQLPSVGDRIEARTEADSFVAVAADGYSVQIDRFAHCETDIIVELTEVGETMRGTVANLGELPKEGQEIEIRVSQGTEWAKTVDHDFSVSLTSPALVTGIATGEVIRLEGNSDPTVDIDSYDDDLPSVGDTFEGIAHTRSDTVEIETRPYDIYIPEGIESYGRATGKIISVDTRIEGKIDDIRFNRDVSSKDDDDHVGSMNDLIHNTSL